jgi:hypothetical protein
MIYQHKNYRWAGTFLFSLILMCAQAPVLLAQDKYKEDGTYLPSLKERELGEPVTDDGERVIYDRALPFWGQKVIDLGFELPNPYGVAAVYYWQEQDLILDNLAISVDGGPVQDIDFVDFGTPSVENTTGQFKADAWLLPFMNVYVTLGKFDGDGTIPLAIEGKDLLDFLGFDRACTGRPNDPEICDDILTTTALPKYEGQNIVFGTVLAMGWEDYFVTLPISYAISDVDIIDTNVEALNISPRIGINKPVGHHGSLAMFIGATYLKADIDIAGSVAFDTSGTSIPGLDDSTTIDFIISQRNKDRWNYTVGMNWEVNRAWSFHMESGFGGSRKNFVASATFRF